MIVPPRDVLSQSFFQSPCSNLPKPKLPLTPACTKTHLHSEDFSICLVIKYLFCNLVSGSSQATMQLCGLNPDCCLPGKLCPLYCLFNHYLFYKFVLQAPRETNAGAHVL